MGKRASRRIGVKVAVAATAVALVTAGGVACSGDSQSDPERLVDRFTSALDRKDVPGAAALTSYPNAATASLQQIFDGMKAETVDYKVSQFISLDGESGFFTLDAAWHLGKDKDWTYSVQGSVRKLAVGWRVSWDPSVVMPEMGHGRSVNLVRTDAAPPRVLDALGGMVMAEQTINAVTLDPARMPDPAASTAAVSKAIEPVAPLITGQSLMQNLVVARGKPITAVSLRDDDFAILEPMLTPIPGVVIQKQPRLITTDRRIDSPMLDALGNVWQQSRDATAGWAVQISGPDANPPLQMAGYQGPPPPDVASTLDPKLQLAAEDAVVSVGTASTIVAIQPSSGAVLAVAQNNQASDQGTPAFTGLYPAGSNIDILRAAASVEKGEPPQKVSSDDIAKAAGELGVGVDFKIPGLDETTGQLPNPGKGMEPVSKKSDSDAVKVSPFGMAILAASMARGSAPLPMIVRGQPATTQAPLGPIRGDVIDRLRGMAHDAVARPDYALREYPDVSGIPTSDGNDQWFIGTRGDLAFAVFVKDADGSDLAMKMTARMLKSLARPSE